MIVRAYGWYLLSLFVMLIGVLLAARYYPGGFDWIYTVASALASQEHNPVGSVWFAGSVSLSMLLLWPYISALQQGMAVNRFAFSAMRVGLVSGMLLGMERLLIRDLSHWFYKAHEVIALLTFFGLFLGVISLLVQIMQRQRRLLWPVVLIAAPLIAIGVSQLWLYLDQRHLGWVDVSWREKGIPIWFSFAFWQWLAIAALWAGMGLLNILVRKK